MRRLSALLALLLLPTLAFAQAETTGRVTGTVLDEAQKPVAGAEITFESPALQGERKMTADADGKYLAALLPPGVYLMSVNAPGKIPAQYTFRLGVGQTVPLDPVLKSGEALAESITVYAPAAKFETTAGGENFAFKSQIDLLPITNRTLDNVANLAPNVSFGPTANTLSISGAPTYDNSVLLDGADISDPYYSGGTVVYLEESIEEMQVLTNGVSARYGRFQGGVINATTKSGGNTYDGTVRVDLSKQSWNEKTPYNEDQSDTLNKVYSATFGGPILKDHLWFFLGGRTIPVTSTTRSFVNIPGSFTSETDQDRYQAKLTGSVNPNHTIEASYLEFTQTTDNYRPTFTEIADPRAVAPERGDDRKFYTAEYQGVLTDRMFLNAQVAKKDVSITSGGDPGGLSPILEYFDGEYRLYANGWWDPNDPSVRDNESAALSMTHSLSFGSWGDHTIEYGIQYVNSITAGDNRQSPTGYNLYLNTPVNAENSFAEYDAQGNPLFDMYPSDATLECDPSVRPEAATDPYCQYFNERLKAIPGAGEQEMKNLAFYLQDAWEIGKWRLDVGLRYENWEGQAISPAMNLDFSEVAPRLGVTYNITPEWQLQGTWGKYISRFNDQVANGVSGISSIYGPGLLQEYIGAVLPNQTAAQVDALLRNDANWGTILGFVDPLQPTTFFASGVGAPYAEDLTLSVKRALPKNQGVVTLTYSRRDFKELLDDFKGGLGISTVNLPDGSAEDVDTVVWENCGECARDYDSITLGWDYRPGAVWDVGGNYTYSRTQGNYEGEANQQPAIGSIIGNYPTTVDPVDAYPYGYISGDIRHRARLWGNYRFDFARAGRLSLGGILYYRSAANFSRTGRVTAGDDPTYLGAPSSYTKFFDGRGNNRYNGFWNLDTTVRYDFSIYKDLGAYLKFDIVNITNNDSLITFRNGGTVTAGPGGIATWVPNSNFGTPTNEGSYQTPRSYYVVLGLNW